MCKSVKTCASALKLLQGNITPQIREFLQKSQCIPGQPWICCAPSQHQSSFAPNETSSKGKLPRAPDCGFDSPNRIFGGEETKIDEYPWLVQLGYIKGTDGVQR